MKILGKKNEKNEIPFILKLDSVDWLEPESTQLENDPIRNWPRWKRPESKPAPLVMCIHFMQLCLFVTWLLLLLSVIWVMDEVASPVNSVVIVCLFLT